MDSKKKEFDPDDMLLKINTNKDGLKQEDLNNDLKEISEYENVGLPKLTDHKASPEMKERLEKVEKNGSENADSDEKKDFYDSEYWKNPYTNNFKLEDLLQE